jgi:hypothetical protein
LIEKTITELGTDPRLLLPNSGKLVWTTCSSCKKTRLKKFSHAISQRLCLLCSNKINAKTNLEKRAMSYKEWLKTHPHPRLGSSMSEHTKQKLLEANLGKTLSEETKLKIALAGAGRPYAEKARLWCANHRGVNHHRYGHTPSHGYKIWYTKKDGTEVCFRSTWEARVARWLDIHSIEWEYESTVFPVRYLWNGSQKLSSYRPDFWLPIANKFIEVKGFMRTEYREKFKAFIEHYPEKTIELWDKKVLGDLGIDTGKLKRNESYGTNRA